MDKIGEEFVGVVEYLEGEVEVEVLVATDHQNDVFGKGVGAKV